MVAPFPGLLRQIPVPPGEGVGVHHHRPRRRAGGQGVPGRFQLPPEGPRAGFPHLQQHHLRVHPGQFPEAQVRETQRRVGFGVHEEMGPPPLPGPLQEPGHRHRRQARLLPLRIRGHQPDHLPLQAGGGRHGPLRVLQHHRDLRGSLEAEPPGGQKGGQTPPVRLPGALQDPGLEAEHHRSFSSLLRISPMLDRGSTSRKATDRGTL